MAAGRPYGRLVWGGQHEVLLNVISRSRAERIVMTPTCLVLTACALLVAAS